MSEKPTYQLTEEHKAQIPVHAGKWRRNAESCEPMSDEDRAQAKPLLAAMYVNAQAAPPKAMVFVRSHLVLAVAGSIAAKAWEHAPAPDLKMGERREIDADLRATIESVISLFGKGVEARARPETYSVQRETFEQETRAAVFGALATSLEGKVGEVDKAIQVELRAAPKGYYDIWNGGNLWSGYPATLSFFRDVCKFDDEHMRKLYAEWEPYEKLALISGPRMMGEDFAIVCDRPLLFSPAAGYVEFRDGLSLKFKPVVDPSGKDATTAFQNLDVMPDLSVAGSEKEDHDAAAS